MDVEICFKETLSKRILRLTRFICRHRGVHYSDDESMPRRIRHEGENTALSFLQPAPAQTHLVGDIRLHRQFYSRHLEFERSVIVYLPPSYKTHPYKRYPVLYMHDGNNVFDPRTSFAGVSWEVNDTVEKLVKEEKLEEVIVVGIYNTPARLYEYTWTPMNLDGEHMQGGHGKKYARFLVRELKQFIDKEYRTLTDRQNTAIMGSSLGGLINFYVGRHYSDVFGKIAIMSPSFWWGNGIAYKHAQNYPQDLKIWMDIGIYECGSHQPKANEYILRQTRMMREALLKQGYQENINLRYFEDPHGHHNEYSWGKRLHRPLLFFFGKNQKSAELSP